MTPALNIGRIAALKSVRDEIKEIRSSMAELSESILTDWALLPSLYQLFQDLFSKRHITQSIYHRQKFLFVVLFLYCPSSLAGGRMPQGFRKVLASTLGLNATTTVSDNCSGLMVLYRSYPDFRRDADLYYEKAMKFVEISLHE